MELTFETLHEIIRNPETDEEKEILLRCYKEGMKNGWASGKFARADGDFIVEEDRLNKNSISFIDSQEGLIKYFKMGNWCLGAGIIYKNLFFLNQIDGGDEWAIYYIKEKKIENFESYSIKMVLDGSEAEFIKDLKKMLGGNYGK